MSGKYHLQEKKIENAIIECSDTESLGDTSMDLCSAEHIVFEDALRDEAQRWLADHGAQLFALEASKFLSRERRRKNLASKR